MATQRVRASRRRFLGQAAASMGALTVPWIVPASSLGKDGRVAASSRINVGVIGGGVVGTMGTPVEVLHQRQEHVFYKELWDVRNEITAKITEQWEREGVVTLYPAFFRKPDGEVTFVQHRLWKDREKVRELYRQGAIFFLCGEGQYMAPAVRETLAKIYQETAGCTEGEASSWLPLLRSRELTWDGCLNVRDLGGHPKEEGGETSYGSIVRADSVGLLTPTGWQALVEYGIHTVIDLRGDHEREEDPPGELPVEVLHVPFMEASEEEWEEIGAELESLGELPVVDATRDAYLIFLERFKPNVGAAIRAVADAPEGGVVVHCVGGKDRTGLVVALLPIFALISHLH